MDVRDGGLHPERAEVGHPGDHVALADRDPLVGQGPGQHPVAIGARRAEVELSTRLDRFVAQVASSRPEALNCGAC